MKIASMKKIVVLFISAVMLTPVLAIASSEDPKNILMHFSKNFFFKILTWIFSFASIFH